MPRVYATRQAELDLIEIWLYVAEDSEEAADRLVYRIDEMCENLASNPQIGRQRNELAPQLRSHPVLNYLLFYRPRIDGIDLIRVLHGARELDALFDVTPSDE